MKRFLYADDGFFSVYAMLLLSIAMLFSTFLFCKDTYCLYDDEIIL